jgi:hypothetical protein
MRTAASKRDLKRALGPAEAQLQGNPSKMNIYTEYPPERQNAGLLPAGGKKYSLYTDFFKKNPCIFLR